MFSEVKIQVSKTPAFFGYKLEKVSDGFEKRFIKSFTLFTAAKKCWDNESRNDVKKNLTFIRNKKQK
jgi:hypothetical protein